ncbi:hypothetical protein Tco_1493075 [Tanacetum coccineum]
MQTKENHSNPIPALNVDSLKVDLVVIQNTCSEKEDTNSETTSSISVKESSLDFTTKDVHAIKHKMSKAKERSLAYFRSLYSHIQVLSIEDLKGTRIEHGFKRAFMSLFGQDADTFTSIMLLNVDQLQKQLDKDEFQEDKYMAAFWVVNNQFQKFIDSQFTLDYDSQMIDKTDSTVQDESSKSGNDTDADDADIRPIYDEEPMAEVQLTAECNIFAIGQQHTEQTKLLWVLFWYACVDGTRPDVAFAQNITSQFQQNPGDLHWTTVKNSMKVFAWNTKEVYLRLDIVSFVNGGLLLTGRVAKQSIFVFFAEVSILLL